MDRYQIALGILIPFFGTSLGAACVLFLKKTISQTLQSAMNGFAAGVMVAASVWSLLLPSIEQAEAFGKWAFVPASVGFCMGTVFLLLLDRVSPWLPAVPAAAGKTAGRMQGTSMLVLAVTIHNIPEGMAVGAVYAGLMAGNEQITAMGALALSAGIAVQNFPEGAIVSIPLCAEGFKKRRAFSCGVLSGIVEPAGALLTIWAAGMIVPILPYLLSFAAGAMMYVVVDELIPEMSGSSGKKAGSILFAVGFLIMMILDVALG